MPEQIETEELALKKLSAELEAMSQELAALSYSVSHDLRSPLRTIDGFSEALAEEYQDKLDERGLGYLKRIRDATARMESLIDSLLELARVSRGEIRREPVDLSELAESIAGELKGSDPSRNVHVSIEPGLTMTGDPRLLRVAFEHLLRNSWKFTSKHPIARIEMGREERDGHHLLYVRDDGAGFDPNYSGRMFAPFQRFHSASEFEGMGIGLAMVHRIIRRHGGKIWATGEVERGATVYIEME